MWTKLKNKRNAVLASYAGTVVYFVPCRVDPHSAFSQDWGIPVRIAREDVAWHLSLPNTTFSDYRKAFNTKVAYWQYYNACHELGYYPHYYTKQEKDNA
jgi:hypothetical protein